MKKRIVALVFVCACMAVEAIAAPITLDSYVESKIDFTWKFTWDGSLPGADTGYNPDGVVGGPPPANSAMQFWDVYFYFIKDAAATDNLFNDANLYGRHKVAPDGHVDDKPEGEPLNMYTSDINTLAAGKFNAEIGSRNREHKFKEGDGTHWDIYQLLYTRDKAPGPVQFTFTGRHFETEPTTKSPEPGTWMMAGLGVALVAAARARRTR